MVRDSMSGREAYFDNMKFLLVALVVLGHLLERHVSSLWTSGLYQWIYCFHVPCLVFVSGRFSSVDVSKEKYVPMCVGLVFPYLIFQTLYYCVEHVVIGSYSLNIRLLFPYHALWYLFSLMSWRLMLPLLVRIPFPLVFAVIVAVIAGFDSEIGQRFSLSRTFFFLPFFLAGFYSKKRGFELLSRLPSRVVGVVVLGSLGALIVFAPKLFSVRELYGSLSFEALGWKGWEAALRRSAYYLFSPLAVLSFMSLVPRRRLFFTGMGTRTMTVFLLHTLLILIYRKSDLASWVERTVPGYALAMGAVAVAVVLSLLLSLRRVDSSLLAVTRPRTRHLRGLVVSLVPVAIALTCLPRINYLMASKVDERSIIVGKGDNSEQMCSGGLEIGKSGAVMRTRAARRARAVTLDLVGDGQYQLLLFRGGVKKWEKSFVVKAADDQARSVRIQIPRRMWKAGMDRLLLRKEDSGAGRLCGLRYGPAS